MADLLINGASVLCFVIGGWELLYLAARYAR
jgi:hypothetical protein